MAQEVLARVYEQLKTTDHDIARVREIFQSHIDPSQNGMSVDGFGRFLVQRGVKREYINQYFKAFDRQNRGVLDMHTFLLGVLLMDPATPHEGFAGELRVRYIFRVYDLSGSGTIDGTEFVHLIRHIRRAQGKPTDEQSMNAAFESIAAGMVTGGRRQDAVTYTDFLDAVQRGALRGTSTLFRFQASVLGRTLHSSARHSHSTITIKLSDTAVKAMAPTHHRHFAEEPIQGPALIKVHYLPKEFCLPKDSPNRLTLIAEYVVKELLTKGHSPTEPAFTLLADTDVIELCGGVVPRLQEESSLVRLGVPAKVFGDIHGQLKSLTDIFEVYGSPHSGGGGDIHDFAYVFIGDFVDRGARSLEVVVLLLSLKILFPKRVVLLRGNHEDRDIQRTHGFLDECHQRFLSPARGNVVWEAINTAFDWLPLGAVLSDSVLCIHGGLGKSVHTLAQIESLCRPIRDPKVVELCMDILWSDPTENDCVLGVHANPRGGAICTFGSDRVENFCASNGLQLIIRAHQCVEAGFEYFAKGKLITVFSATNYCNTHRNDGAIVQIDASGVVRIKCIRARDMDPTAWSNTRDVSPLKRQAGRQ